jgi:uncharacterized protein
MSIHTDIKGHMIEAMKAKDSVRLTVIRGLLSAFTNENVNKKRRPDEVLPDEEALTVLSRQAKQRKDSIEQFENGGRPELAESEKVELAVIESYLPQQMSREEVEKFVSEKIESMKPTPETKNQFMGAVMKELKGKADGSMVKEVID